MSVNDSEKTTSAPTIIAVTSPIWRPNGPRNPLFTGRQSVMQDLTQRLRHSEKNHVQAIVGLGGVGKTQLASEFAWRYRELYRVVWWLPADDATTLALAYGELAKKLKIDVSPTASLDLVRHELRRVLGQRHDWLLIFDNAESADAIRNYLPLPCTGHALITSRDTQWSGVAQVFPLRPLPREESISFLRRRAGRADDDSILQRVAQALGDHPLAMEQASAHVVESRIDFTNYLKQFESHWAELLTAGIAHATPGAEYPDSLAMSLELSFRQLGEQHPEAQSLLNLCSFFAGEIIPQLLLDSAGTATGHSAGELREALVDRSHRAAALAVLRRYSLVEGNDDQLQIHRLVSLLARRRLSSEERQRFVPIALAAVVDAFRFDSQNPQTWSGSNAVLPHVLAVTTHAISESVDLPSTAKLLNLAGRLMMKQSQLTDARDALERSLAIAQQIHGPNHARLSVMANDLGRVLQMLGDSIGAREQFEAAMAIDGKVYGENDVHLTSVINNHAITLNGDGDFAAARDQLQKALASAEFHYGPDNRRVALIRNNYACTLRNTGDVAAARAQFEQALTEARNATGEMSPLVAQIAFNLGAMLRLIRDFPAASHLLETALQIDSSNHPSDHPSVVRDEAELRALRQQRAADNVDSLQAR